MDIFKSKYYATFAEEHRHPTTGESMYGYYVVIDAEDDEAARFAMFNLFHDEWAFLFTAKEWSNTMGPKGEYASCVAPSFNLPHDKHERG